MEFDFFDCHTHSEFSSCAEDVTLSGYAEIARTTNTRFAVTDHSAQIFYPPDNRWGFWSDEAVELFEASRDGGRQRVEHWLQTLREAQTGGMLVGTELDVLPDGRRVFPDEMLETLDVVLGAVHSMPTLRDERPVAEIHDEFRFQVEALAGHGIEVLVHPYRLLLAAEVPVPEGLVRWTVEAARELGFALEINSHKQYPEHDVLMARMALEEGVPLAIGTDTHRSSEFGDFSYHERVLAEVLPDGDWARHLWEPTVKVREAAAG